MKEFRVIFILILIFVSINLAANELEYILGINAAAHYNEYPKYKYNEPVLGLQVQLDIFNIIDDMGIGGATFQKIYSFDDRFSLMRTYSIYLNNFSYYSTKDSYFTYGFYGGVKRTEINYEHYETLNETGITIHRPLLGFHFATEVWGIDISWTQAEDRKPIMGYELKLRNSKGILMRIGRINRGLIIGNDSEIYILLGYEFFK